MRPGPGSARRLAALLIVVVFAAGILMGVVGTEWVERPPTHTFDYAVTARHLVQDFRRDDIAASKRYSDKLLNLSGIVDDCFTDNLDRRIVELRGIDESTEFEAVKCIFPERTDRRVYSIHPGDTVSIVGRCVGEGVDVLVVDCKLM